MICEFLGGMTLTQRTCPIREGDGFQLWVMLSCAFSIPVTGIVTGVILGVEDHKVTKITELGNT